MQIKAPDLGAVHHIVDAVLDCRAHGVVAHVGGSCCETERAAQVSRPPRARRAAPTSCSPSPGMGVDEGLSIVRNEMERTLRAERRAQPTGDPMIDFTDRVVLMTGAAGGIGAATARTIAALRRRRGRCTTCATGGRLARARGRARRARPRGRRRPRRPARRRTLWREALAWRGRVDVLDQQRRHLRAGPIDDADRAPGPPPGSACSRSAWSRRRRCAARRSGRSARRTAAASIVNLASRAALRGEDPEYWHYAAAKAGIVAMTKTIARQYGRDGVTAFARRPGLRQHAVQRRAGGASTGSTSSPRTPASARWPARRTSPT